MMTSPLFHPSFLETPSKSAVAEGAGFEPARPCGPPVFKTGAINHSTTPPLSAVSETLSYPARAKEVIGSQTLHAILPWNFARFYQVPSKVNGKHTRLRPPSPLRARASFVQSPHPKVNIPNFRLHLPPLRPTLPPGAAIWIQIRSLFPSSSGTKCATPPSYEPIPECRQ